MLEHYLSNVRVLSYGAGVGGTSLNADVPVLVPSGEEIVKDNQAMLIAKRILESGKLLIITSGTRPLNSTAVISFLQGLGLDKVTLDNIKSAIHEKNIVREGSHEIPKNVSIMWIILIMHHGYG